jgi:hypothetical protein
MARPHPEPARPPPRTNVEHLTAALDSPLAFHGLRPHVTVQLAEHLARQGVIALASLPPQLRTMLLDYARR